MLMQASPDQVPVLLTIAAPRAKTHRREAVVATLIRMLDSSDVEGRTDTSGSWATIRGTDIQVQVWPGVSSIGAIKKVVMGAIPTAKYVSTTPLTTSFAN